MKKRLGNLRERIRRDNRGLSLVEVMCAVAILALVSGIIGTVIVMSTRTYRRGISETGIQQEAQLAANSIGNLVKDACGIEYRDRTQWLKDGEQVEDKKLEGTSYDAELVIGTNDNQQYNIRYYAPEMDPSGEYKKAGMLQYLEGSAGNEQMIAGNIVGFSAETKGFKESKTIELDITVHDVATKREIPLHYTMKSRNDAIEGFEFVEIPERVSIYFPEREVVLVPGEEWTVPFEVSGTLGEPGFEFVGDDTWGIGEPEDGVGAKVEVPLGTTDSKKTITIRTKAKNSAGLSLATGSFDVLVRRVRTVSVSHTVDTTGTAGGMRESIGAVYTFSAAVTGDELDKRGSTSTHYDDLYKNARAVVWSFELDMDDTDDSSPVYQYPYVENGTDVTPDPFKTAPLSTYFKKPVEGVTGNFSTIQLEVIQELPANMKLTVRATSKHALGVNKAGSKYYDALGSAPKDIYYGEDNLMPRDTTMVQGKEITLEPFETGTVVLGTKGGRPTETDVTFDFSSDRTDSATTAVYVPADDAVKITLGKDEKGSGAGGANPYTFTVGVKVKGTLKTTITVHVRRIDKIWVGIVQDEKVPKTYDFRARINVTEPQPNKQATTDYLYVLKNKELCNTEEERKNNVADKEIVAQTLSSKITWEFYDLTKSKKTPQYSDWVICEAGVGKDDKGTITSKSDGFQEKRTYYQLTKGLKSSVKPARIELYTQEDHDKDIKEGNARASEVKVNEWYIRQYPEVDLTLTNGSLPANTELRVTIEMLHSQGSNKNGFNYYDEPDYYNEKDKMRGIVYASASVFGNRIYTDSKIVVVEPGQGNDSYAQSDEEIVIPIHSEGEDQDDKVVHHMRAEVIDSNKTRRSDYSKNNPSKPNPYCFTERKPNGKSEWLLGLVVDKDERGDKDGYVTVKVEALDKDDTLLTDMEIKLAVRRVNSVSVNEKNNAEFSSINTVGNTVTLEAYPKGEGTDGIAYYGVQTKNYTDADLGFDIEISDDEIDRLDKVCRWETTKHGRYRSPLKMDWTLTCDGSTKSVKNSEYLSNVKIEEILEKGTDDKGKEAVIAKSVLTFTLVKELPQNAKFRATSLHALGKVENDKTKYNKAGQEYGKVSDEWPKRELITVSGGWKRGGTLDIAYNIPKENITYVDGKPFLVKDGQTLWDGAIATRVSFKSKYNGTNQQGNHLFQSPSLFTHNPYDNGAGIGGERGQAFFEGKTLTEYTATIYAWGNKLEETSYSSPYTKGDGAYIDLSTVELKVNVGTTDVDATNTIAVDEKTYSIPDVVFQYRNSLPETSKQDGDNDGAWTKMKEDNILKVYVTPDDTISGYKSYYKLSEGWEETYEKYTLLPSRYVGVINDDKKDDSFDERLFDFAVTNTTGEGNEEGRSYVEFKFTKNVRTQYKNKVVKMIYEYNPYLCNTNNNSSAPYAWAYGTYKKEELDEIDGCDGILEFHFVDANINVKKGVTMPEVRYCPTYSENSSSATPNYYYISSDSRFYIDSDGKTAQYQTGGVGKWKTNYSMTYADGKWTIK